MFKYCTVRDDELCCVRRNVDDDDDEPVKIPTAVQSHQRGERTILLPPGRETTLHASQTRGGRGEGRRPGKQPPPRGGRRPTGGFLYIRSVVDILAECFHPYEVRFCASSCRTQQQCAMTTTTYTGLARETRLCVVLQGSVRCWRKYDRPSQTHRTPKPQTSVAQQYYPDTSIEMDGVATVDPIRCTVLLREPRSATLSTYWERIGNDTSYMTPRFSRWRA